MTGKDNFLAALDHLRLHPSTKVTDKLVNQTADARRIKRSVLGGLTEMFSSLFGSGGSSYDQATIDHIKENLRVLQSDINIQDSTINGNLALINLTRVEVGINRNAIHTLDLKLIKLNYTLSSSIRALQQANNKLITIASVQHHLSIIRTGLARLELETRSVHNYLASITTHVVTPNLIPPEDLRKVLKSVKTNMKSHPRLELPIDPVNGIWDYYNMIKIHPVVFDDYLMIMLEVPLVDKSLKMDVYQVHNLPILHPMLKKTFKYKLESEFIGITNGHTHIALLAESDILRCILSGPNNCKLETALYPVEKSDWCVYALFIKNVRKIQDNCKIDLLTQKTSLAVNLQDGLWAISSLATEKLQIQCLTTTNYIDIIPPFQLIKLPNSCEAYSPSIFIPAYTVQNMLQKENRGNRHFLGFDQEYVELTTFRLIKNSPLMKMSEEEIKHLSINLEPLTDIPVGQLPQQLKQISENYPQTFPTGVTIFLSILGTAILITAIGVYCYYRKNGLTPPCLRETKSYNMTSSDKGTVPEEVELELMTQPAGTTQVSAPGLLAAPQRLQVPSEECPPKIKATPESVRRCLEEKGFDFSVVDRKIKKTRNTLDSEDEGSIF